MSSNNNPLGGSGGGGKPPRNMILPTTPMFESIMGPKAKSLVGKLCKIRNFPGHTEEWLNVVKEIKWNSGPTNDNLQEHSLNVGTIGMVVGVAEPKTTLRFLVTTGNESDHGLYHVGVMFLELLNKEDPEEEDEV